IQSARYSLLSLKSLCADAHEGYGMQIWCPAGEGLQGRKTGEGQDGPGPPGKRSAKPFVFLGGSVPDPWDPGLSARATSVVEGVARSRIARFAQRSMPFSSQAGDVTR